MPAPDSAVDRDNPWPGLSSFTEELSGFFFGRERETEELVRLVRRNTLTVLFGQSGLGKSSLLQAGAFPILREADFLPLYLRLDHDPAAPALADQVKAALARALGAAGADAPAPVPGQTLWEYFHRKDIDIWSAKNRLLVPVLAFDQFEEIFTLGRADEARRERGRAFLTELADLVENRPPAALQARFDAGELDPAAFAFDKPSGHVILSLREDFLPDLEGLKGEMRSLMLNRMRIKRLTGTQARQIVSRPAPHLLAEGVAERVVEFIAGARGGSAERLEEMEVEPALLSVICRELNQRRRALGREQITADLVSGNRQEILTDFYERSVADLPAGMREFVEDHLLTKSGFRDNLALETALEARGVTRPLIDLLVSRRLLRIEDRLGVQRVELTHDVLADVIRASRDSRQQRRALAAAAARERQDRRRLWWLWSLAAGLVVLLAAVTVTALRSARRRDREAARSDLVLSDQFLERGDAPTAIACLVRAAETDPRNPVAGTRLISALARANWPIWQDTGAKVPPLGSTPTLAILPGGREVLVRGDDGVVHLVDLAARREIRAYRFPRPAVSLHLLAPKAGTFAADLDGGGMALASAAAAGFRLVPASEFGPAGTRVFLEDASPDGQWIAVTVGSNIFDTAVCVVQTRTGRVLARSPLPQPSNTAFLAFSPDSTRIALADWNWGAAIFRVPALTVAVPWFRPSRFKTGGAACAVFSPDGAALAVSWWDGVRLVDAATGLSLGAPLPITAQCEFLCFDHRGRRLFAFGNDRAVRIFDLATRKETVPPLRHGAAVKGGALNADDSVLAAGSNDDRLHLWDPETGKELMQPLRGIRWGRGVGFTSDGRRLLYASPDGRIGSFSLEPASLRPLVWTPLGPPLRTITGGLNATVTLFDSAAGRNLVHFDGGGHTTLSLDSFRLGRLKAEKPGTGGMVALDVRGGIYLGRVPGSGYSLWRTDGQKLADLAGSSAAAASPAEVHFLGENGPILILRADGRQVAIRLWPRQGGAPLGPEIILSSVVNVLSLSVSSDGTRVALGTAAGWAGIWEVATARRVVRVDNELHDEIAATEISPDGRFLATGGYTNGSAAEGYPYAEYRLWDAQTGQPLSRPFRHRENIAAIAFSPDSKLAAFAGFDGTVDVVATATGRPPYPALVCSGPIVLGVPLEPGSAVGFTDAHTLYAATDHGVCLWDAGSGLPAMQPYATGAASISHLSFDPARTDVAAIDYEGRAFVWPLPPHAAGKGTPSWLLELARTLAGGRLDGDGNFLPSGAGFAETEANLADVRRQLALRPKGAPFAEWGRWILADPATRGIAPGLDITAAAARRRGLAP